MSSVPSSQLNFSPDSIELGVTELVPVVLDFTNYVQAGETITGVSVTVTGVTRRVDNSAMVSSMPIINGMLVEVWLDGSLGVAGQTYRLEATITKSTGAKLASKLHIKSTH